MLSKTEAGYRAPDHCCPCLVCRRFDAYLGACSVVEGFVRPDATCDRWRSVEDKAANGADLSDEAREPHSADGRFGPAIGAVSGPAR